MLLGELRRAAQRLLQGAGRNAAAAAAAAAPAAAAASAAAAPHNASMFAWATVAGSGSGQGKAPAGSTPERTVAGHAPHTHAGAVVSGVYYARARGLRRGEGDICLEDPRGALPPFGGRHRVPAVEGEALLWPGWLVHHVTPCCTGVDAERVSIAFNIAGAWAETGDVSVVF